MNPGSERHRDDARHAFLRAGHACPPMQSAGEADIAMMPRLLHEVKRKARAYLLKSMSTMKVMWLTILIANVPVTVTYCDHTGCTKLFTDQSRGKPLRIDLMGFSDGLLLRFDDRTYRQDNGRRLDNNGAEAFPFRGNTRLDWQHEDWKNAHPDTMFHGKGIQLKRDPKRAQDLVRP